MFLSYFSSNKRSRYMRVLVSFCAVFSVIIMQGCSSGGGDSSVENVSNCIAAAVSWSAEDRYCEGSIESKGASGSKVLVTDDLLGEDRFTGKASYICTDTNWILDEQSEISCKKQNGGIKSFTLNLKANPDGRWYDYYSDAFTEIGHEYEGSQILDGFFALNGASDNPEEPYVSVGGTGVDFYVDEGDWNEFGVIFYDVANCTGVGECEAPISSIEANLDPFVPGGQSLLNDSYITEISSDSLTGVVVLNEDGLVIGVELSSIITFIWFDRLPPNSEDLVFSGPFLMARDGTFTLNAGDISDASIVADALAEGDITTVYQKSARWDFSGVIVLP